MTTIGKNVKIIAPESVRTQARAVFELIAAGLEDIEYHDKNDAYFVGPAGVVFRLAALAS